MKEKKKTVLIVENAMTKTREIKLSDISTCYHFWKFFLSSSLFIHVMIRDMNVSVYIYTSEWFLQSQDYIDCAILYTIFLLT